jgi:hypothetical protein
LDADAGGRSFVRTVAALAAAGSLSTLAFPAGLYISDAVSGVLYPLFATPYQDQFAFLRLVFGYTDVLYPWVALLGFRYVVPFLLFFFLGGWARVDPHEDLTDVAVQSFAWGFLVNILGPALDNEVQGGGPGLANSIIMQLSNPFADFGIVGGATVFAMMAVTGTSFGYFWSQDHFNTIRSWLQRDRGDQDHDAPEEQLAEAETREAS